MSLLISLQCCDSELLHVRELHRGFAIRPAGGHEVQLSASQSHFPGAAAGTYIIAYRKFSMRYILLNFLFLCPIFPSLTDVVGYKQGAQQASWIYCGYQNTQQAGWQWSRHVPHHWNTGGCQYCIIYAPPNHYLLLYSAAHTHIFS